MFVLPISAVPIASMASVSMRGTQLAVTQKETMAGMNTEKENWLHDTIHTMLINMVCATFGKRKENRNEERH
jgi:hypothetical protein